MEQNVELLTHRDTNCSRMLLCTAVHGCRYWQAGVHAEDNLQDTCSVHGYEGAQNTHAGLGYVASHRFLTVTAWTSRDYTRQVESTNSHIWRSCLERLTSQGTQPPTS